MMRRGTRIDHYRIVERLGTTVFLVEHEPSGRRGALQMLRGDFADVPDVVARCFNEACVAATTCHPGIAKVYDVGCTPAGQPFIVGELIAGPSLASRLGRGPLSLRQALATARSIALALASAHDRGVAHGSLCPDRIFIEGDSVKLSGFGLAGLGGGDAMACVETCALGLPVYASPEQCRATGAYDARSDLYALGCILFEMITGRPPFISERFGELLMSHLMAPPPELNGPAAALVERLLAKSPTDRPATAAEVAATLAGLLRAREPEVVHPWRWVAGFAIAIAAVMSTAYDARDHFEKNVHVVFHKLERASLSP